MRTLAVLVPSGVDLAGERHDIFHVDALPPGQLLQVGDVPAFDEQPDPARRLYGPRGRGDARGVPVRTCALVQRERVGVAAEGQAAVDLLAGVGGHMA